jgi:serine protease Do
MNSSALAFPVTSVGPRFTRQIALLAYVLAAALWPVSLPGAPKSPSATERIYRRCEAACVEVLVNGRHSGSGWFARKDGLVVTAAHMFDRRDAGVEVVLPGRGRLACSLLAIDRGHDTAILKTKSPAGDFPVLVFASAPLRVGDEILQFGAPLFRAGVLQPGRVARPETLFEFYPDRKVYVEVVHVVAMMQPGTSGGPWLDHAGNVVGLQSGLMSIEGKPVGIAYVVPAGPIRALLKRLCDAETPDAGFWVDHLWERDSEFLRKFPAGVEGLVVSGVRKDGPAAQAGIQSGDVVISAEESKVVRIRELLEIVRGKKPGAQLSLRLLRAGSAEPLQRTLTVDRAEADVVQPPPSTRPDAADK